MNRNQSQWLVSNISWAYLQVSATLQIWLWPDTGWCLTVMMWRAADMVKLAYYSVCFVSN